MASQDLRSFQMFFFCCYVYVLALLLPCITMHAGAQGIGVDYGMLGNNLPSAPSVVSLYQPRKISKLRIFNPNSDASQALTGSGIEVILGTLNEDLKELSTNQTFASNWVNTNVVPYTPGINFSYICAGNEVIPGDMAAYVLPAIQNLDSALRAINMSIPVTTAISTSALGTSYPPSTGAFSDAALASMAPIISFLAAKGTPLLVNVYPYFAYAENMDIVRLHYALFTAPDVVVQDGALGYKNLFDTILDAVYSAMEKAGGPNVSIVVSETGWPSAGNGNATTVANAQAYDTFPGGKVLKSGSMMGGHLASFHPHQMSSDTININIVLDIIPTLQPPLPARWPAFHFQWAANLLEPTCCG